MTSHYQRLSQPHFLLLCLPCSPHPITSVLIWWIFKIPQKTHQVFPENRAFVSALFFSHCSSCSLCPSSNETSSESDLFSFLSKNFLILNDYVTFYQVSERVLLPLSIIWNSSFFAQHLVIVYCWLFWMVQW